MSNDQRVIYKYRLQDGGTTKIKGWFTKVIHVGEQDGELMLWMENTLAKPARYESEATVYAIGTGWPYMPHEVGQHIGTVQMSNGLVWHIFIADVKWVDA